MKRPDIESLLERVSRNETVAISSEEIAELCRYVIERDQKFEEHLDWCSQQFYKFEDEIDCLKKMVKKS